MENLTRDLTIDILSRLPTLSLLQSSCVCKSWHHIITADPTLSALRNNRSTTNNYTDALVLTSQPTSFTQPNQLYFTQLTHPHSTKKIHLSSFIHGKVVGVCNGLICLATTVEMVQSFHIVNPISKQHLHLQLPYRKRIHSSYGFGFDKRNQVFKLVVFDFTANDDSVVFTVASGWRRVLGSVPYTMRFCFCDVVYVDGCLHWITPHSTDDLLVIRSFNLSDEAFGVIQTPESIVVKMPSFLMQADYYTLAVLDNCLCWVDSYSETRITIWIKKSDESWTNSFCLLKSLIIPYTRELVTPIKVDQNGQLYLQFEHTVVCYNVRDNTTEHFTFDEEPYEVFTAKGFPFVGSFTSTNSH